MEKRNITLIFFTALLYRFISVYADSSIPKTVKPIRYTLTMETNLDVKDNCTAFNGSVVIELLSSETASNITLNIRNLEINKDSLTVIHSGGSELKVSNVEFDEEQEFFIIHLKEELLADEYYNLSIGEFSGIMTNDNVGFYLAKYTTKDGEER